MIRLPPRSTRTDTLFPYTTLFRSRQLTKSLYVSPQISVDQVAEAKALGVTVIINNRPDDEEPGQTNGAEIEAAAKAAGIAYAAVPVAHGGFSPWQLDGMAAALEQAGAGKILAYCRSGPRSRSEERRVGTACGSTCRSRWSPAL